MSRSQHKLHLITITEPWSPVTESYRGLRTNIDFSAIDRSIQVVVITSSTAGEGKSTIAGNLAVAYAQADRRVLLLDANLRSPAVHWAFGLLNDRGLSTVLTEQCEVEEVVQDSRIPHLRILTAGPVPLNPAELLASNYMQQLLQSLREAYDMIVIDTPALLDVADAQIMATQSDGVVLVARTGSTKRQLLLKAKSSLEHVSAPLIGVVMSQT